MSTYSENVSIDLDNNVDGIVDNDLSSEGSPGASSDGSSVENNTTFDSSSISSNNDSGDSGDSDASDGGSDIDMDVDSNSDTDSDVASDADDDLTSEMDVDMDADAGSEISAIISDQMAEDRAEDPVSETELNNIAQEILQNLSGDAISGLSVEKAEELLRELDVLKFRSSPKEAIDEIQNDMELQNYLNEEIYKESAWLNTKRPHPRSFFKFSFVKEVMSLPYSDQALYFNHNRGKVNVITNQISPCNSEYLKALLQDFCSLRLPYFQSIFKLSTGFHDKSFIIILTEFLRLYFVPDLLPTAACRVWFFSSFKSLLSGLFRVGEILEERRVMQRLLEDVLIKHRYRKMLPRLSYENPWQDFLGINEIKNHNCNQACTLWQKSNTCLLSPVAIRILSLNEFPIFDMERWMRKEHPNDAPPIRLPWTMHQRPEHSLTNYRGELPVFHSFLCQMPSCLKRTNPPHLKDGYTDSLDSANKYLGILREKELPNLWLYPARMLVNYHVKVEDYEKHQIYD